MAPSISSATPDLSPPPPRRARIPFPSLAFANHALKSPPSPPSTTISPLSSSDFSSSTTSSPSSSSTSSTSSSMCPISTASSYVSCAFPDWPKADVLSPASSIMSSSSSLSSSSSPSFGSAYSPSQTTASSYITDEDLLDLATLPLYNNIRIPPELLIAPTPMAQEVERERRRPRSKRVVIRPEAETETMTAVVPGTTPKRRRPSGSPLLKRRKLVLGLSPVAE